jgi:N-methylhydantoinase A
MLMEPSTSVSGRIINSNEDKYPLKYKLGVDVGGTFTDFLVTDSDGESQVHKTPTTPSHPEKGVFDGLQKIADNLEKSLEQFLTEIEFIVHGTTITTNAVLTANGAKTAFLTTKGFRDILNMRRGLKERQFDFKYSPPPPIVPRHLIFRRPGCFSAERK